jgi:hypothetical protein
MKKLLLFLQNRQTQVASIVLFVLSVSLVVYLTPREVKFKYEFQKGKPWLHENLVAPFDFPVLKAEEAIEKEKQKLVEDKTLFLYRDSKSEEDALTVFEKEFKSKWRDTTLSVQSKVTSDREVYRKSLFDSGLKILNEVFSKGILKPFEGKKFDDFGELLIIDKGISRPVQTTEFFTIQEAVSFVREELKVDTVKSKFLRPLVITALDYNIVFDAEKTDNYLQTQIDNVLPTRGVVQRGELVIVKGNIVDDEKYAKLSSLKQAYEGTFSEKSEVYIVVIGQILLISMLFLAMYLFLYQFRNQIMEDTAKLTFILFNVLLMVIMAKGILLLGAEYMYLAPFAMLPIILRSFFDTRIALFVHMVTILLVGFLAPNSFEFVFLQFVAGVFAIVLVTNLYKRSQLFLTATKIIVVYCLSYLSLAIIQEGSFEQINLLNFAYFAASGFLTLISFPLIYFEEKVFGLVSDVSLLELSDTNNPLLRELSQKAPGTFQHSLQVANLAEAATLKINGNALLVRTGALYHDVGKMQNPMYFIENQSTGVNPHDELSFEESAQIIIGHVKEGIKLAKKYNLPDLLVDFIRTHHGTSTVMYFYKQYIKNFPKEEVDLEKFTYPGPNPFSKETAVLMMADSVEAASKSLDKPDSDKIDKLVEGIVNHQMETGQFENAEITLKEIREVKKVFKKILMNIYHVRIQYPE